MITIYDEALAYLVRKTTPKFVYYTVQGGHDAVIAAAIEVANAVGETNIALLFNEEGRAHVQ